MRNQLALAHVHSTGLYGHFDRTKSQFAMKFVVNIHEALRPIVNGVGDLLTFSSSANKRSDFLLGQHFDYESMILVVNATRKHNLESTVLLLRTEMMAKTIHLKSKLYQNYPLRLCQNKTVEHSLCS